MPTDDEWQQLIDQAAEKRPVPTRAVEYRRAPFGSFAGPPLLYCEDGAEYWVKHTKVVEGCPPTQRVAQAGGMVTDHIVGHLARILADGIVPPVACVLIDDELKNAEPRLSSACTGPAHGSKNAALNCTNRMPLDHAGHNNLPMNRRRVACIAVLYGLAMASDHQVIYRLSGDPLVYSVDHGHFFPGGPMWSAAQLAGAPVGEIDRQVTSTCKLSDGELAEPLTSLENLREGDIAEAVAAPPDEWFFPPTDRIAVANFLWKRRANILEAGR